MNNYRYLNYNGLYRNYRDSNSNLYSPSEGYMKGNMFSNLYSEYKNYKPNKLVGKTERERALYELDSIAFAMHELNLYLDLNPNDNSMILLYNDYNERYRKMVSDYELRYGPLCVDSGNYKGEFNWIKDWPWEVSNV